MALKRLRHDGPLDVVRFKGEFRALADVAHGNLVRLHGLWEEDGALVLAMDLVEGRPFLHWVWDQPLGPPDLRRPAAYPGLSEAMLDRLRRALRGLTSGLSALHAAGLLHRDVKPSNVLVTEVGEVQVVDFGLATRPGRVGGMAGTATYMAPEQAMGLSLGPASDWYAVGCMLFEALTGAPPFRGMALEVLARKQAGPIPDPAEHAPGAPTDLVELCRGLLQTRPEERAGAEVIAAVVGATLAQPARAVPLIGREDERRRLRTLLTGAGLRVVHVTAPSGLGKTRLIDTFLEEDAAACTVLASRCYERERTTFKALDPVAQTLAELGVLDDPGSGEAAEDRLALMRLLPTLARGGRPAAPPPSTDPVLERRRASRALRRVLAELAAEAPLALWIDDLHWADRDSLRLLSEVLDHPTAPEALVLLSWRSDDPQMAELLPLLDLPAERLDLQPLDGEAAASLVRAHGADEDRVQQLVGEAAGSPFFLAELTRWTTEHRATPPRLDRVVRARVGDLPPGPRALLEAVAVAGRPLAPETALTAARSHAPDAGPGDLVPLTVDRLLTTRRGDALECTHDQIREAVVGGLSDVARAAHHRALAEALGPTGSPAQLAEHWFHAGDPERAAPFALRAAEVAAEALAFERAVALYRWALELGSPDDVATRAALGRALARAGHAEAADVLLRAAATAGAPRAELEREALNELLRRGRFEEAYRLLPEVVGRLGLPWPATRAGAVLQLLWDTAATRLSRAGRGARDHDREALQLALDLSMSLSFADMLRTAVLTARAIRLARRIGEPETLALASAMRGSNATLLGELDEGREQLRRARALLPAEASPQTRAVVDLQHGIAAAAVSRYADAIEQLRPVAALFEERGMPYEAGMAQTFLAFALVQAGRLDEARALREAVIASARSRGDKHLEVFFRVSYSLQPELVDDDPAATRANIAEAEGQWGEGVSTAWLYTEVAHVHVDVYEQRHVEAVARADRLIRVAGRGGLLRVTLNALGVYMAAAAAAAPLAAKDRSAAKLLERSIAAIEALATPLGPLVAAIWRASRGGPDALSHAERALGLLEEVPNPWLAAMVRAQRAALAGDDPAPHHDTLRSFGIRAPARLAALYAWSPR